MQDNDNVQPDNLVANQHRIEANMNLQMRLIHTNLAVYDHNMLVDKKSGYLDIENVRKIDDAEWLKIVSDIDKISIHAYFLGKPYKTDPIMN